MNRLRSWKALLTFAATLAWLSVTAWAESPTVVLSIQSVDDLLESAEMIGTAVGQEGLKQTIESNMESIADGNDGIDRKRALGAYWTIDETDQNGFGILVAFIPVSDQDAITALLNKFILNFEETSEGKKWNGSLRGIPIHGLYSDNYLFVSTSSDGLDDVEEPESIVNDDYVIAVDLNVKGIPDRVKEAFLQGVEVGARQSSQSNPGPENEAEARGRELGEQWSKGVLYSLTKEGDKITFGIDVDDESRMVSIDLGLSAVTNSALAKSLNVFGKLSPAFANVPSDDTPLSLVVSMPTTGILDQSDILFSAIRSSANAEIEKDPKLTDDADKKAAKDVANRLIKIAESTIKSGSLHAVMTLEQGEGETIRVLGGTRLAKGDDANKLWDDILALSKESPDFAMVKSDIAKHAGARIHSIATQSDEKQQQMFGDDAAHLAIRSDSLWFSIGGGNLDSLKKSLELSGKKAAKQKSPISLRAMPATIVTLMEHDDQGLIQRATELAGKDGDVLRLEVTPNDKSGIKVHFEFGLDLFGLAGPVPVGGDGWPDTQEQ